MTGPEISVVVATHDRPARLAALLASLERVDPQTPPFEVVVVDDASGAETRALLDREVARGALELRVLRRDRGAGPAVARNAGWRAARAPLIAFTDDDCEVDDAWLRAACRAWDAKPLRIIQGRTDPNPAERHRLGAFSRTIQVATPGPPWETCNIFFPRTLLEAVSGFDERFPLPGGEDTDLAWRSVLAGAEVVFVPEALVHHAVIEAGAGGMLRYAWHWHATVPLFARYPELRRRQLHRGVFWSPVHEQLLLALLAGVLPRRLRVLRWLLAFPYLRRLVARRSGPLLAPYILALDVVELAAMVRGSVRDRVLVL